MEPREVGLRFEQFMGTYLARTLRSTMKDGPFADGPVAMFGEFFDQAIGEQIARGGGLHALAEDFVRELPEALGDRSAAPLRAPSRSGWQLTSSFGERVDPIDGSVRSHHGIDLGAASGTPIKAAAPGRVVFAGERGGYGNLVIVEHADGVRTRYAHCRQIDVAVGQEVDAGAVIAQVGSTGRSTGPHLHFEVRRGEVAVDPAEWLTANRHPLD